VTEPEREQKSTKNNDNKRRGRRVVGASCGRTASNDIGVACRLDFNRSATYKVADNQITPFARPHPPPRRRPLVSPLRRAPVAAALPSPVSISLAVRHRRATSAISLAPSSTYLPLGHRHHTTHTRHTHGKPAAPTLRRPTARDPSTAVVGQPTAPRRCRRHHHPPTPLRRARREQVARYQRVYKIDLAGGACLRPGPSAAGGCRVDVAAPEDGLVGRKK
jgi:hypothetical protein